MGDSGIAGPDEATVRRHDMVAALVADGWITTPSVERAFRIVPRHAFVPPGTTHADTYDPYGIVVVKRGADDRALSSISAPWIQAWMIEHAALLPGARVLEVGSGGYNAALLAEIAGRTGRVVSVDIDPEVVARAREALARTGYGARVAFLKKPQL